MDTVENVLNNLRKDMSNTITKDSVHKLFRQATIWARFHYIYAEKCSGKEHRSIKYEIKKIKDERLAELDELIDTENGTNLKLYSKYELSKKLGVSIHTIKSWYHWETKKLEDGLIEERYLPVPIREEHMRGQPKFWTEEMIYELEKYRDSIVKGRNGENGRYTNPLYCEKNDCDNSGVFRTATETGMDSNDL